MYSAALIIAPPTFAQYSVFAQSIDWRWLSANRRFAAQREETTKIILIYSWYLHYALVGLAIAKLTFSFQGAPIFQE